MTQINILDINYIIGVNRFKNTPLRPYISMCMNNLEEISLPEKLWTKEIIDIVNEWETHYELVRRWCAGEKSVLDIKDTHENAISEYNQKWGKDMIERHKLAYIRNKKINSLI